MTSGLPVLLHLGCLYSASGKTHHKIRHFQRLNFNLEASFINLTGHKNVGKSVVNSKICFTFEKVMLKSPTFLPFFSMNLSQKLKIFFF